MENFDLGEVLDSGQVFHWSADPTGGGFAGCIGDLPVHLRQVGRRIEVTPASAVERVRTYLRLDQDHGAVLRSFPPGDAVLREAVEFCPGLRILRQPAWECLATFITSSLKQVAHIRQISLRLRRAWGEPHEVAGHEVFAYPEPSRLAAAGEERLRACGLGYRAASLHRAACDVAGGRIRLEEGEELDDPELVAFLCRFHGVGEKIANCVRLFGYGRLGAFPIDVWIERVLRDRYFSGEKGEGVKRRDLEVFARDHFGEYGGYAQQYLFHHARKTLGKSRSRA